MTKQILILNGPNLNLLGTRQPEVYGTTRLSDIEARCQALAKDLKLTCDFRQSNHEGELVDWIQGAGKGTSGIIINPAAYSHTSVAILDALKAFEGPVLEVHISNIHARESFRHFSYVSMRADGVIAGFGPSGYEMALRHMADLVG